MKKQNELHIAVLEDNLYYNKLLALQIYKRFEEFSSEFNLSLYLDCFYTYSEFMNNFNKDTDLAFIDFRLDNNFNAIDAMKEIKRLNIGCSNVVLSDETNIYELYNCLYEGASGIVLKNESTFEICAYLINNQVQKLIA